MLYENQRGENRGQFAKGNLQSFAAGLGLDGATFSRCLDRGEDLARIREAATAARQRGITGTPGFIR